MPINPLFSVCTHANQPYCLRLFLGLVISSGDRLSSGLDPTANVDTNRHDNSPSQPMHRTCRQDARMSTVPSPYVQTSMSPMPPQFAKFRPWPPANGHRDTSNEQGMNRRWIRSYRLVEVREGIRVPTSRASTLSVARQSFAPTVRPSSAPPVSRLRTPVGREHPMSIGHWARIELSPRVL